MLLHPRRRSWKLLMRWAFERYLPALGPAVLLGQQLSGCQRTGPKPHACRLLAGFLSVEVAHRGCWNLLACHCMHQHLQEWLASNCRITKRGTGRCQPGAFCTVAAGAASCCALCWRPHGWGPAAGMHALSQ